jgi:hypothetical protein
MVRKHKGRQTNLKAVYKVLEHLEVLMDTVDDFSYPISIMIVLGEYKAPDGHVYQAQLSFIADKNCHYKTGEIIKIETENGTNE